MIDPAWAAAAAPFIVAVIGGIAWLAYNHPAGYWDWLALPASLIAGATAACIWTWNAAIGTAAEAAAAAPQGSAVAAIESVSAPSWVASVAIALAIFAQLFGLWLRKIKDG